MNRYIITITCPDRRGIIAAVTSQLSKIGANILDLSQHTASDIQLFMLKGYFELPSPLDTKTFSQSFTAIAREFSMQWQLHDTQKKEKAAILTSKTNHCLWELLLKHQDGELDCDIPLIISNHTQNQNVAQQFGIQFHHFDYTAGKESAESAIIQLLKTHNIDLVIMARFMQILSPIFIQGWRNRIINIHHGFLPAFKGAKPYHQAWYKGVKIIGATAHFANEDLDQGPIIAQEVINVSDRSSIKQLIQMGKDIERRTLIDAVKLYLNHAVFVHKERTFILR